MKHAGGRTDSMTPMCVHFMHIPRENKSAVSKYIGLLSINGRFLTVEMCELLVYRRYERYIKNTRRERKTGSAYRTNKCCI
jgi:hypothetical protein